MVMGWLYGVTWEGCGVGVGGGGSGDGGWGERDPALPVWPLMVQLVAEHCVPFPLAEHGASAVL